MASFHGPRKRQRYTWQLNGSQLQQQQQQHLPKSSLFSTHPAIPKEPTDACKHSQTVLQWQHVFEHGSPARQLQPPKPHPPQQHPLPSPSRGPLKRPLSFVEANQAEAAQPGDATKKPRLALPPHQHAQQHQYLRGDGSRLHSAQHNSQSVQSPGPRACSWEGGAHILGDASGSSLRSNSGRPSGASPAALAAPSLAAASASTGASAHAPAPPQTLSRPAPPHTLSRPAPPHTLSRPAPASSNPGPLTSAPCGSAAGQPHAPGTLLHPRPPVPRPPQPHAATSGGAQGVKRAATGGSPAAAAAAAAAGSRRATAWHRQATPTSNHACSHSTSQGSQLTQHEPSRVSSASQQQHGPSQASSAVQQPQQLQQQHQQHQGGRGPHVQGFVPRTGPAAPYIRRKGNQLLRASPVKTAPGGQEGTWLDQHQKVSRVNPAMRESSQGDTAVSAEQGILILSATVPPPPSPLPAAGGVSAVTSSTPKVQRSMGSARSRTVYRHLNDNKLIMLRSPSTPGSGGNRQGSNKSGMTPGAKSPSLRGSAAVLSSPTAKSAHMLVGVSRGSSITKVTGASRSKVAMASKGAKGSKRWVRGEDPSQQLSTAGAVCVLSPVRAQNAVRKPQALRVQSPARTWSPGSGVGMGLVRGGAHLKPTKWVRLSPCAAPTPAPAAAVSVSGAAAVPAASGAVVGSANVWQRSANGSSTNSSGTARVAVGQQRRRRLQGTTRTQVHVAFVLMKFMGLPHAASPCGPPCGSAQSVMRMDRRNTLVRVGSKLCHVVKSNSGMTWKLQDASTTAAGDAPRRVAAAAAGTRGSRGAGAAQFQGKAGAKGGKPPGGQRVFSLALAKAGASGHSWRRTPTMVPSHMAQQPSPQPKQGQQQLPSTRARAPLQRYLQRARARAVTKKASTAKGVTKPATRYCATFCKTGACKDMARGLCTRVHDPSLVAVCPQWLQGSCTKGAQCLLQHKVCPDRMPVCAFFLQGMCTNDACPYLHVKYAPGTPVCQLFLKGCCPKGSLCPHQHLSKKMLKEQAQAQQQQQQQQQQQ